MTRSFATAFALVLTFTAASSAEKYELLTGVNALRYPGPPRFITQPPVVPIFDGDRLAGTADDGPMITYQGTGAPMFQPNQFGSLSFMWRRGHIPFSSFAFLGIEFIGGPLLDLDGDLNNGVRRLVPTAPGPAVVIPDTTSYVALAVDLAQGAIDLLDFDATGCNEGGPGIAPEIATIVVTIAGTDPNGLKTGPINPGIDTRTGTLIPVSTSEGIAVSSVYAVQNLGFELWEDTLAMSGSFDVLGTMQFLGTLNGYLVERSPATGQFPILAGLGLGGSGWPAINTAAIGQTYITANGLAGGTATIATGVTGDNYTAAGNGGVALADFGGNLGAYLDAVVVPNLPGTATRFVYLTSAGFGINNSNDPVFVDTIGYDVTLIAANTGCEGNKPGDVNCDGFVTFADIDPFVAALGGPVSWYNSVGATACKYLCVADVNRDGAVTFGDIDPFVATLGTE